jgi:hypothetical protein
MPLKEKWMSTSLQSQFFQRRQLMDPDPELNRFQRQRSQPQEWRHLQQPPRSSRHPPSRSSRPPLRTPPASTQSRPRLCQAPDLDPDPRRRKAIREGVKTSTIQTGPPSSVRSFNKFKMPNVSKTAAEKIPTGVKEPGSKKTTDLIPAEADAVPSKT